jgi:DNA primase
MSYYKGIPQNIIEDIKQRNDIVSVVGQYVSLEKKSSQNLFGLCPFHGEKTPSFSVSPQKQIYYCFGCHKGGDVFHFLMDVEKIGYFDAVKMLAEKAKIELPVSDNHEFQKKQELQKILYEANTEAARYYYKTLISDDGKAGIDYLRKRGIDNKTIRKFGLGFARNEWSGLYNHLRSKGYTDEIIFLTGLVKKREDKREIKPTKDISDEKNNAASTEKKTWTNQGMYDLLRNRLIFPIFDYLGRVIAFGGRVMDDSMPKYINSPETPIYIKGRHLYGFHIAKSSKEKRLVIVEGYMDAISMHQAGFDNAVASLGTALTENQAMLLRRHSQEVVIAYDSDMAGQAATVRGLEILMRKECKVFVLVLPEGKDPDDFIRKNGAERFAVLIKDAIPFMDYKLKTAYDNSIRDGKFDAITYQQLACDVLSREENMIVRELYASKVAEILGISLHSVLDEVNRRSETTVAQPVRHITNTEQYTRPEETDDAVLTEVATATKEELYFLCLLASDPSVIKSLGETIEIEYFSKGLLQMIVRATIESAQENKLTPSTLVEIGADNIINKRKLAELFASGFMKTEDMSDVKEITREAKRLYSIIKKKYYMEEKERLIKIISESTEADLIHNIKNEITTIEKKLRELRN